MAATLKRSNNSTPNSDSALPSKTLKMEHRDSASSSYSQEMLLVEPTEHGQRSSFTTFDSSCFMRVETPSNSGSNAQFTSCPPKRESTFRTPMMTKSSRRHSAIMGYNTASVCKELVELDLFEEEEEYYNDADHFYQNYVPMRPGNPLATLFEREEREAMMNSPSPVLI